ncbi:MAG: xanthine dehydrogenase family protein molybdopterin-binding subunit, partial [Actinobacteria bacterium]|nr:xanthine dehydrogenase family protein molybdopterin-binding subunit [Actinomycetota bacterium]
MGGSILGNRVIRKEDPKFLTLLTGAAHVTYVRSTVAHGVITGIDTSDALNSPGVIAVFTGDSLDLPEMPATFNPMAKRTLLARTKVRYVGEPIAAVITETREQGEDAAELVIVDYDVLPALIDIEESMASTNLIYEECGSNVVFDTTALGMPDNTGDAIFANCEVVVKGRFINQRVAPCPLEVRGSAVAWVDGRL